MNNSTRFVGLNNKRRKPRPLFWAAATLIAQVAGGLAGFMLSVWYIKHFDYAARTDDKMQPVITAILSK